jgi:beta-aspartyl-peptidase (threonine type)
MLSLGGVIACLPLTVCSAADPVATPGVVLGIHGGTGVSRAEMTPQLEKDLRAGLLQSLEAGEAALKKPGATSLDAVEAAIRVLEDDPWFNAGRGAVFTHDGRNELDASIMEGQGRRAGAVAGVSTVKNPITAARSVMEKTKHVLLIGKGAEAFAAETGLDLVDPAYFRTEHRWNQLQDQLREERESKTNKKGAALPAAAAPREWSTVGAVAVDRFGNLAAGTSTGGMSNKRFGRVGDSPIIGAGTFADNATCAVSCTGHGEFFIRWSVAHEIASLVRYRGLTVQQAADDVLLKQLKAVDGEGAAIVLDAKGNFAVSHNSDTVYRGYVTADGKKTVLLYDE